MSIAYADLGRSAGAGGALFPTRPEGRSADRPLGGRHAGGGVLHQRRLAAVARHAAFRRRRRQASCGTRASRWRRWCRRSCAMHMSTARGSMQASMFGLYSIVDQTGRPELNAGALQRFLGEAIWFPTALLPSTAVTWTPRDDRSAIVTLRDGATVSLRVRVRCRRRSSRRIEGDRYKEDRRRDTAAALADRVRRVPERDGMIIPLPLRGLLDHRRALRTLLARADHVDHIRLQVIEVGSRMRIRTNHHRDCRHCRRRHSALASRRNRKPARRAACRKSRSTRRHRAAAAACGSITEDQRLRRAGDGCLVRRRARGQQGRRPQGRRHVVPHREDRQLHRRGTRARRRHQADAEREARDCRPLGSRHAAGIARHGAGRARSHTT